MTNMEEKTLTGKMSERQSRDSGAAGKVALITGSASGIGRALACEFMRKGFLVCATDKDAEKLQDLQKDGADTFYLDVTDTESVRKCVADIITKHRRIDYVLNNAGYGYIGPTVEMNISGMKKQFDVNFFGCIDIIQAVFPYMASQNGGGTIVDMSSISAVLTPAYSGAYSASKAALHTMSDSLRLELHPWGINVISVQPGRIGTNFGTNAEIKSSGKDSGESRYKLLSHFIKGRANSCAEGKPTTPEEFAKKLVAKITRRNPPHIIRLGKDSLFLPAIKALLPSRLLHRMLLKKYGLDMLKLHVDRQRKETWNYLEQELVP